VLIQLLLVKDPAERATYKRFAERSLEIARSVGDQRLQCLALDDLTLSAYWDHDPVTMKRLYQEGSRIARRIGDERRLASLMATRELLPDTSYAERRSLCEQGLSYFRRAGDRLATAMSLYRLSDWHLSEGHLSEGRPYLDEAIAIATELDAGHFVYLLQSSLCLTLLMEGKAAEAAPVLQRNLRITHRLGDDGQGIALILFCAACCATWLDLGETAARLHGAADAEIEGALADGTMFGWSDLEQQLRTTSQDRLRQLMGDAEFEAAYRSGAQLTRMQAIELALGR
jgi:hypothetical protein